MIKKIKKTKAITLVALIITIIALLILATVSINLVINGGILNKATEATQKYLEEEEKEQIKLAFNDYQLGKLENSNEQFTLDSNLATVESKGENGWNIEFKKSKNKYSLSKNGQIDIINTSEGNNGNTGNTGEGNNGNSGNAGEGNNGNNNYGIKEGFDDYSNIEIIEQSSTPIEGTEISIVGDTAASESFKEELIAETESRETNVLDFFPADLIEDLLNNNIIESQMEGISIEKAFAIGIDNYEEGNKLVVTFNIDNSDEEYAAILCTFGEYSNRNLDLIETTKDENDNLKLNFNESDTEKMGEAVSSMILLIKPFNN